VFDYVKTRNTAVGLLNKFGRAVTLKQAQPSEYDPETGTNTAAYSDVPVIACDFAVKGEEMVNGTQIIAGDRYALVADGTGIGVTVNDKLLIDGVTWSVIAVLLLAPGGVTVINKVYIRK
jgi:hypothetical protein